jgi:hypothetical protein
MGGISFSHESLNLGILLFMIVTSKSVRNIIAFAIPLPTLIFILCFYNLVTTSYFGITKAGIENLSCATSFFWQDCEDYPAKLREAIRKVRAALTSDEREILDKSWDFAKLSAIYDDHHNTNFCRIFPPAIHPFFEDCRQGNCGQESNIDAAKLSCLCDLHCLLGRLAVTAIENEPTGYVKFVITQLHDYFLRNTNLERHHIYYTDDILTDRYVDICAGDILESKVGISEKEFISRTLTHFSTWCSINANESGNMDIHRSSLDSIYFTFQRIVNKVFLQQNSRVYLFFVLGIYGLIHSLKTRFRDGFSFLVCVLFIMNICHALVICLVEQALTRYSCPMDFTYYIVDLLYPVVIFNSSLVRKTTE